MNGWASLIGVFAFSAALAGVGGGIYGMALGSAAPDVFQFFSGLPPCSPGDGHLWDHLVRCGGIERRVPGIAVLHQFLPSTHPIARWSSSDSAASAWGPPPMGPSRGSIRPVYLSVARRRWLMALMVAVVGVAWVLRLSGAIGNWTMAIIMMVDLGSFPVPVYVADYRAWTAPPAFGLPERRSKDKRDAWFAEAVSDDGPVVSADPLTALSGTGGTSGT